MTARRRGVRNALYLWLVSGIVAMGNAYATAWGVFHDDAVGAGHGAGAGARGDVAGVRRARVGGVAGEG